MGMEAASRLEIAAPTVEAGGDLGSAHPLGTVDTSNSGGPCLFQLLVSECPPPSVPLRVPGAGDS